MKRLLALVTVLAGLMVPSAQGITYGTADGNLHPYVGALVGTFSWGTGPYCSGTLISPTVFLTAAHCAEGTRVSITLDEKYTSSSKLYWGTWYQHPAYYGGEDNPNDVAVIVLDRAIKGVTPAKVVSLGLLDRMKADGTLNQSTAFTSVGYGAQEPGHANALTYLDTREYSIGYFNALGPGYLRISQNPATGNGGTCYGDSGGPQFLGGVSSNLIVSVTVTGDWWCRSTNVTQRLDIASVQNWLKQFVSLN